MIKNIIWDNWDIELEQWEDFLTEEYPEVTDENKQWELVTDLNNAYLEDERTNLDIQLNNDIIVIADLGLWNGRRQGYRIIKSGNIKDCLYDNCDYITWYCDRYNFRANAIHHDGTNHYLYRVFRDEITEKQKENFLYNVYNGRLNQRMIRRYTKSIQPYIARVYGWKEAKTA